MTNPFQSIIGEQPPPANPSGCTYDGDERNSIAEMPAEDTRAEKAAATSVPRPETGQTSEQSASTERVETGFATLPPLLVARCAEANMAKRTRLPFSTHILSSVRAIKRLPFSASTTMARSRSSPRTVQAGSTEHPCQCWHHQSTQVGFGRQVLERTPQASPEETCIQARRHDRAE